MVGLFNVYQYIEGTILSLIQPFKKTVESQTNVEEKIPSIQTTDKALDSMNVLLLGSDTRGEDQARTDTIMVGQYRPENHEIKIISFMRDLYVTIPEHGQQKLNAAYTFGGPELLMETIKENFGLDLQYYAVIDFQGFEKAVDLLVPNGIQVDIPYEMSEGIDMTLEKGEQHLNGKELLGYVRFRQDRLSDFGRVERQQEVMTKLMAEAVNLNNVVKLPELIEILNTYIDTNMEMTTLLTFGKNAITNKTNQFETLRIPVEGSFENQRVEHVGEVLTADLEETQEVIEKFLNENSLPQH